MADTAKPSSEAKSLPVDEELPAPLPDPFGLSFSDEELDALTETDSPEAVKLAFAQATPDKRALLGAQGVENGK